MRRIRVVPPVYLLAAVLAMFALHWLAPVTRLIPRPWHWAGLLLIVAGLGLGFPAMARFRRHGTTFRPGQQSTRLITDGPFRYTRNPMYLSMVLMLAGLAVLLGTLTPWLPIPLFVWLINRNVIPVEEAMIAETFGEEYRDYQRRVRRWV